MTQSAPGMWTCTCAFVSTCVRCGDVHGHGQARVHSQRRWLEAHHAILGCALCTLALVRPQCADDVCRIEQADGQVGRIVQVTAQPARRQATHL